MNSIIVKALTRFEQADQEQQDEVRDRTDAFRRLYGFLSQVIPFGDSKLEKLDAYIRFLQPSSRSGWVVAASISTMT